jgi:hypothetical protein
VVAAVVVVIQVPMNKEMSEKLRDFLNRETERHRWLEEWM